MNSKRLNKTEQWYYPFHGHRGGDKNAVCLLNMGQTFQEAKCLYGTICRESMDVNLRRTTVLLTWFMFPTDTFSKSFKSI
jgi:hypothetical protein